MAVAIQLRRDTAANWTSANPVLAVGEMGVETDTLAYKIGDGVTAWNALPYRELAGNFAAALLIDAVANPSTPAAGKLNFYAHDVGGRILPKIKGPSGMDTVLQAALFQNNIIMLSPSATTAFNVIGIGAPTVVGTASTPAIATGGFLTIQRRTSITSAGTANSASEVRAALALCYRGETIGSIAVGGFFFNVRWGATTAVTNQRSIVGLLNATGATSTSQNPSDLVNCVFMGNDSADANYQIMHNDGSGTCTKINLGASFPVGNVADVFDLTLFCPPGGGDVSYRVINLRTGAVASGTITTNQPAATTTLTYHTYLNNGGTAAAVVLEQMRLYLETDY